MERKDLPQSTRDPPEQVARPEEQQTGPGAQQGRTPAVLVPGAAVEHVRQQLL